MGTDNYSLGTLFGDFIEECRTALAQDGVSKELGLTGNLDVFLKASLRSLATDEQSPSVVQQPKTEFGLPDFSVAIGSGLQGYIEFKAVDKDVARLKTRHDKDQQELLVSGLQNLIYTNGWKWQLWQDAQLIKTVTFDEEIFSSTTGAMIDPGRVSDLEELLKLFLSFSLQPYSSLPAAVGAIAHRAKALRLALEDLGEERAGGHLIQLKQDFEVLLYRNGQAFKWENFIDSYVQIAAFGALLWRLESRQDISLEHRVGLKHGVHPLLYQCLTILWNEQSQNELITPLLRELVRTINLVPLKLFEKSETKSRDYVPDPIIHAYEPFFKHYDKERRDSFGVYYTPVQVVQHIISGVDSLMKSGLGRHYGILDEDARFLDPATGTGTFLLGLANEIARAAEAFGIPTEGVIKEVLTERTSAFELFPGPYTIAHQRLETLLQSQGTPAEKRLPVYLTDTLAEPERGMLPMSGFGPAGEHILQEREKADFLKTQEQILVILGNPPYERMGKLDSGWDRFTQALMQQVVEATPAKERKNLKSAIDLFVAFWAWALWALQDSEARLALEPEIDTRRAHGITAFVTNRTWIVGPSLIGLRNIVLRGVKEVWVYDLGGDNRGGAKEFAGLDEGETDQNVFKIQTGVAIVWLVFDRNFEGKPTIRYRRTMGKKAQKLAELARPFDPSDFEVVTDSTTFMPASWPEALQNAPSLPDLFDYAAHTGFQTARDKRKYTPIGLEPADIYGEIKARPNDTPKYVGTLGDWRGLPKSERLEAWKTTSTSDAKLPPLSEMSPAKIIKIQYRPLDERHLYNDPVWIHRARPKLQQLIALGSSPTIIGLPRDYGRGPLATYTELLPQQHAFRGSAGGAAVFTLYRMGDHGRELGLTDPVLRWGAELFGSSQDRLKADERLGQQIFSYILAVLSAPAYAEQFWPILESVSPSVPLTKSKALAKRAVKLGDQLRDIWNKKVDNDGIRWRGKGQGKLGAASWSPGLEGSLGSIEFTNGQRIDGVSKEMWTYTISGYKVLPEYFADRVKNWNGLNMPRSMDALHTVAAVRDLLNLEGELNELLEEILGSETDLQAGIDE